MKRSLKYKSKSSSCKMSTLDETRGSDRKMGEMPDWLRILRLPSYSLFLIPSVPSKNEIYSKVEKNINPVTSSHLGLIFF